MSVSKELWSAKVKECDNFKELYIEAKAENDKLKKSLENAESRADYYYCQSEMNGTVISTAKDKQVEINKLKGYLAEVGEDYDARDEGEETTQYGDWFNKVTNNEFL